MKVAKEEVGFHPESPNAYIMARLRSEILKLRREVRNQKDLQNLTYLIQR